MVQVAWQQMTWQQNVEVHSDAPATYFFGRRENLISEMSKLYNNLCFQVKIISLLKKYV